MICTPFEVDGMRGIICTRGRRHYCERCRAPATIQCDWKTGGMTRHKKPRPKTCDAWLCEGCATQVGEDKHLCPPHAAAWKKHPKNPANAPKETTCPTSG